MRQITLGKDCKGINLTVTKGGDPTALADLYNAFVNKEGRIQSRPGLSNPFNAAGSARSALTFPAGTVGMVGFQGKFHTFHPNSSTSSDARVIVHVVRHPTGAISVLTKIHSAFPFLGKLYIVAEFADGAISHYWLEDAQPWSAIAAKRLGELVSPTTPNGYQYEVTNVRSDTTWKANTPVALNDVVVPTVFNGFIYTATAVYGTAPIRTSNTEPTWPTDGSTGNTVFERRYMTEATAPPESTLPPADDPPGPGPGGGGGGTGGYFPLPPTLVR